MEEESFYYSVSVFPPLGIHSLTFWSVSLFYLVGLFDLWGGLTTLAISAAGAYIISAKIKSPYMPWIGFVFLMGHMSISHLQRQRMNDDSVDITGAP
jgi:lysophospholipid acyltransferase